MFQKINAMSNNSLSTFIKTNIDVENRYFKYVTKM